MKNNYNDIIDIILTFINEKSLQENIVMGGSIVPYLISNKESSDFISDFYILVNEKRIKSVRKKIEKLSRIYLFDIISDSQDLTGKDYGFTIKYEDTSLGLFLFNTDKNNFIIKTYSCDDNKISLKTKLIPSFSLNKAIKQTTIDNKKILVLLPEFVLIEKELSDNYDRHDDTIILLKKICDEEIISLIRSDVQKTKIKVITKKIKSNDVFINILLFILFIIIILIAYICFKK